MAVRPHGALGLDLAGQERAQVVARDGHRARPTLSLAQQPENQIQRARLTGADQHPERSADLSGRDAPVAGHVLGREGNVELELEAHHLAEAGASDPRHFELLDHHQVPVQTHAQAASLEAATVELARELRPRVVTGVERETFEGAARGHHGQREPALLHQEARAWRHRSAGRQESMVARMPGVLPGGWPARR